jgi:CBS domain-containing protein
MSFPPITSKADDDVGEVARILDERRIKRLPVVDDEGMLLGIVSRADIVRAIGRKP